MDFLLKLFGWKKPEPQDTLINGEEAIITASILSHRGRMGDNQKMDAGCN